MLSDPWNPLPMTQWDQSCARHLAARLGFSTHPSLIDPLVELGPENAVDLLLAGGRTMPSPVNPVAQEPMMETVSMEGAMTAEERRSRREARQKAGREAYLAFALKWLDFARQPENSAQEKAVLFFENIWVVSAQSVREPLLLVEHQKRIREGLKGTYPELCKQLARSPAMVLYLNLQQNRKGSPNENFARELFELFVLGEGHYTEADIKDAARATTGYQFDRRNGEVAFRKARHDDGVKRIFGETAPFDLDGLIDLCFRQPAAARFLPQELAKAYLDPAGLSPEELDTLANSWKASGFSIPFLFRTFFSSVRFHSPDDRGTMIKQPIHFLIGALQDLELDVAPLNARTLQPLQQMGQRFQTPPNVRGWVGDRNWINSATLAARRRFIENLFRPLDEDRLNADERRALEAAEAEGRNQFSVTASTLTSFLQEGQASPAAWADRLYAIESPPALAPLQSAFPRHRLDHQEASSLLTLALTAPAYHLC